MAFKSVYDPDFKYRSAVSTDVRLTFERIRHEQRETQRLSLEESDGKLVRLGSETPRIYEKALI